MLVTGFAAYREGHLPGIWCSPVAGLKFKALVYHEVSKASKQTRNANKINFSLELYFINIFFKF